MDAVGQNQRRHCIPGQGAIDQVLLSGLHDVRCGRACQPEHRDQEHQRAGNAQQQQRTPRPGLLASIEQIEHDLGIRNAQLGIGFQTTVDDGDQAFVDPAYSPMSVGSRRSGDDVPVGGQPALQ
jgi:hypothetical protein